jgi:antitoxin component YwqK of YwqJK toxin-antitoxin module
MEQKQYWSNGQLKRVANLVNNKKEGEIIWYYENGNLWEISNWKDNKLEGEHKWYHDNGHLREISYYMNDEREGESRSYSITGEEEITFWKNGEDITEQVLKKRELLEMIKGI